MNRSSFPASIDTFIEHYDMQAQDKINVDRYKELILKSILTPEETAELNNLINSLRDKIWTAEDLNKLQDCITNLETFFKDNTEGYIATKQDEFNTYIDTKSVEINDYSDAKKSEFDVELSKFAFMDEYSPSIQYYKWNVVKLNEDTYLCKQNTLGNPPTDPLYWAKVASNGDQGDAGIGLTFIGEYDNNRAYNIDDAVRYDGDIYYCIQASIGNLPSDGTYWTLFLDTSSLSGDIGILTNLTTTDKSDLVSAINEIDSKLDNKVDKVSGKDLSTEDYTTAEKNKLAEIEAGATNYQHPATHPVGMITGLATVATTGNYNDLSNKPTSLPASGGDADAVDGLHGSNLYRLDGITNSQVKNNPAINNSSYIQGHTELRTTDGSNPILGFHKSGLSATALYHKGYGADSLRIRNADGHDYGILHDGIVRINNGSLQYYDEGVWKYVGISLDALYSDSNITKPMPFPNAIPPGGLNAGYTCDWTTLFTINGSFYLDFFALLSGSSYVDFDLKITIDGVLAYYKCCPDGYTFASNAGLGMLSGFIFAHVKGTDTSSGAAFMPNRWAYGNTGALSDLSTMAPFYNLRGLYPTLTSLTDGADVSNQSQRYLGCLPEINVTSSLKVEYRINYVGGTGKYLMYQIAGRSK